MKSKPKKCPTWDKKETILFFYFVKKKHFSEKQTKLQYAHNVLELENHFEIEIMVNYKTNIKCCSKSSLMLKNINLILRNLIIECVEKMNYLKAKLISKK